MAGKKMTKKSRERPRIEDITTTEENEPNTIFDAMQPGQSFYYSGNRNTIIIKFGYRCARGKYRTKKEGDGWRFYLLKKVD